MAFGSETLEPTHSPKQEAIIKMSVLSTESSPGQGHESTDDGIKNADGQQTQIVILHGAPEDESASEVGQKERHLISLRASVLTIDLTVFSTIAL